MTAITKEQWIDTRGRWLAALTRAERAAFRSATPELRQALSALSDLTNGVLSRELFRSTLKSREDPFEHRPLAETPKLDLATLNLAPYWSNDISRLLEITDRVELRHNTGAEQDLAVRAILGSFLKQSVQQFRNAVGSVLHDVSGIKCDINALEGDFLEDLIRRSSNRLMRAVVLELHVARIRGELIGDSGQARFISFLRRFEQCSQRVSFFAEYPVLARDLVDTAECLTRSYVEVCGRLVQDRKELVWLGRKSLVTLSRIQHGLGDSHCGGRTVSMLRFEDNSAVVYKPRSLGAEVQFQRLLQWFNSRLTILPLRTISVIDRGEYGWVEYVQAAPAADEKQISNFYVRIGRLLCVLYVLQATDFHYENLVAAGDQPILIDCESLFNGEAVGSDAEPSSPISSFLSHSVLGTGLLPRRSLVGNGFENSGIGGVPGQPLPYLSPQWQAHNTDEMRVVRRETVLPGGRNQPSMVDGKVQAERFCNEVVTGFSEAYQVLLDEKDALLAEEGPVSQFRACRIRTIIRPTTVYSKLLHDSRHPDLLRDAELRDDHIERTLRTSPTALSGQVLDAEREDLTNGDIPYFFTLPESVDIWTSREECVRSFFKRTGWQRSIEVIQSLCPGDRSVQADLIRASIVSLSPVLHGSAPAGSLGDPINFAADEAIRLAEKVAHRLRSLAINTNNDPHWVGLMVADDHWCVEELGLDLYSGLPGVVLFLAYLSQYTSDERLVNLSHLALKRFLKQIEKGLRVPKTIGAYAGIGGIIFTLLRLARVWASEDLVEIAAVLVNRLEPLIHQDRACDLVYGSAGCLAALLELYKAAPSNVILELACLAGDRLLSCATEVNGAVAWVTPIGKTRALAGFSHGSAGIIWPLAALGALTGREEYLKWATNALVYERSLFCKETNNWLDLRVNGVFGENGDASKFTAWCHGAAGIGLARCNMLDLVPDPLLWEEARTALATTIAGGFGNNHSICHGDLGNMEAALVSADLLVDDEAKKLLLAIMKSSLGRISRDGWICGTPGNVEAPGLMTGLSGIGYGLLRLSRPAEVPTVLCPISSTRVENVRWTIKEQH